jgi:hypothetical protein
VGLDGNERDWRIVESLTESNIFPVVVIRFTGHVGSDGTAVSSLDSNITNSFSIWMSSISFLFFQFNFEGNVANRISSSNDSMTSVVGLALRMDDWKIWEFFSEENVNKIFHDVINSTNLHHVSTCESIGTFFSDNEVNIFFSVPFVKIFPFFHFEFE